MRPTRALVLAAGRGERMRPLTDSMPKPLLRVGGRPLIVWHLEKLAAAGVREVAINTSWRGDVLRAALGDGAAYGVVIRWFDEGPEPLETAGGIRNALALFGGEPFAVVNGDVWSDLPLPPPVPAPDRLAHLVLVPNPPQHPRGDFAIECGELRLDGPARYTFSGIATYRPALFEGLVPGRRPLKPILDRAAAAGLVTAELHGGRWVDVGTPERLAQLDASLA
jgi:MurNAc alpha-1-phosphate uridylyltransferase